MNGVGMGNAQWKKVQLAKRLGNLGYNQQVIAVNSLRGFLVLEREREDGDRKEFMRDMRERDKVLKRIMDSNLRRMALGFRGARVWTATQRE